MKIAESAPIRLMWCISCCSVQPIRLVGACWHCGRCGMAGDSRSCCCPAAPALSLVRAQKSVTPTVADRSH